MSQIFISHSTKDKILAEKLVELLNVGLGIENESIFLSSLPGNNIKVGENFIEDLKDKTQKADVMIILLSKNYYNNPNCYFKLFNRVSCLLLNNFKKQFKE